MKFAVEHLGLAARNPVLLKEWYERVLGATCVYANPLSPPGFFIALGTHGPLLEIYQGESAIPETGVNSVAGWRHLALQVESIATARATLTDRGVVFIDPVKPAGGGGSVLFFRDAEQNLLHLVERPPGSSFSLGN